MIISLERLVELAEEKVSDSKSETAKNIAIVELAVINEKLEDELSQDFDIEYALVHSL